MRCRVAGRATIAAIRASCAARRLPSVISRLAMAWRRGDRTWATNLRAGTPPTQAEGLAATHQCRSKRTSAAIDRQQDAPSLRTFAGRVRVSRIGRVRLSPDGSVRSPPSGQNPGSVKNQEEIDPRHGNLVSVTLDPIAAAPDAQMRELIDDFLAAQRSPGTRASYASDLAIFLGWLAALGKHPLQAARPDIDRYRNWLAQTIGPDRKPTANGRPRYEPATVARKLSAVRALYTYLTDRRVLAGSPAAGVKGPQVRREPRGRAIADEHVRVLLAAAADHSPQALAIVRLLLLNGLRVTEACTANIEDLQREPAGGHSLLVRGKGGKEVTVALNASTTLAVLAVAGTRSSGPLFRRQDGRRTRHGARAPWLAYNRQAVSRLLVELGQHAGLLGEDDGQVDRLYPHRLRHTFVTMLLDRSVPLPAVQDAARHASADTTRLYDRSRVAFKEHPTHKLAFD